MREVLDKIHDLDEGKPYLWFEMGEDEIQVIVLAPECEEAKIQHWRKASGEWTCVWETSLYVEVLEDILWQMTKHRYGVKT